MALSLLFHQKMTQICDLPTTSPCLRAQGKAKHCKPPLAAQACERLCPCLALTVAPQTDPPRGPQLLSWGFSGTSRGGRVSARPGPRPLVASSASQTGTRHRTSCGVFSVLHCSTRSSPRCTSPARWTERKRTPSFRLVTEGEMDVEVGSSVLS